MSIKAPDAKRDLTDFKLLLSEIRGQIGNYAWMWPMLRWRARQTGFTPRKLYPVLRRFCNPKKPYFIGDKPDGLRFLGDWNDRYAIDKMVEPHTSDPVIDFLLSCLQKQPGTFLDIGANVGIMAATVARANPAQKTVAFEPIPSTALRAMATFALNGLSNVDFYPLALGCSNETITFYDAPGHSDFSSAHPFDATMGVIWKETEVCCRTLDNLSSENSLGDVSVVKIDVEGHELDVLQGGKHFIEQRHPHLLFEYNYRIAPKMGWSVTDATKLLSETGNYRFHTLMPDNSFAPFPPPSAEYGIVNIYCEPL